MSSFEPFFISEQGHQDIEDMRAFGNTVVTTWILLQCFGVVRSQQAVEVKPSVFVRSGSSADLTCTYNTHASDGFTLEWRHAAPGTPAVQAERVLYYNGRLYWAKSWQGRTALVQNPPVSGVASLRIISAEGSDSGVYICEVINPSDWSGSGHGLINLTVMVPPSVPVCRLQGNTYPGGDVTLGCRSAQGLPSPIYSWHREGSADPLLSDSFIEDQRSGSLILNNFSEVLAGVYTCTAANELGQAECSITLRVTYGGTAAVVGGVLTGVLLVLLLFGVTVACVSRTERRHVQKTHGTELSQVNNNSAPPHQNEGKPLPFQSEAEDKSD